MAVDRSSDAAIQKRILTHLNADHAPSLSLYLQHYLSLPASVATNPTLTSMTLDSLTFRTNNGQTHTIPLDPPMKSYAEARARTVAMDAEARKGLGLSTIVLDTYVPPTSAVHLTIAFLVLCGFTSFLTNPYIVPGTYVHDKVLPYFPGGPGWFIWISRSIAVPVLLIHIVESVVMARRLRRYNVERYGGLWWKWMVGTFVEGWGSFQRFDEVVGAKRREKEKGGH
ncbi:hypothetical protein GLAREA_03573 [Glarea lozoyensis ATCC 20868]|uniref:DUF2470 domain-containing protein n=1 Tax=Glarea lozoyensis (strain ATCC 20868 / MF5171) TaxID=1116229 RepID=S3DF46_GLAL2|nr:uncharacterized protein GLAREA_03573 [Glarea lozoyensis ATCC 20868]EPE30606.1 hypothetical protein GLAREA_03573 [Glarea lozoyensis ATCC 20868]